jgi:hypothetical protein
VAPTLSLRDNSHTNRTQPSIGMACRSSTDVRNADEQQSAQRKVPSRRSEPATFSCLPCCVFCDAVLAARKAEALNY